jgi:hypothetical protein
MLTIKTRLMPISLMAAGIALTATGYLLTQTVVYYTEEQRKVIADRMKGDSPILGSCPKEGCQPPIYYNPYLSLGQALIGFGLILATLGVLIIRGRGARFQ